MSADEAPAPPPPAVDRAGAQRDEPLDPALLAQLNDGRYRERWEVLPGTSTLHPGVEPHGALLTTYASPAAMEAIERAAQSMPPGAAIVVEDYLADSTLGTISVMARPDDSDPATGDWRFARFGSAGEVEAGTEDMCRGCHVLDPDFVFGWELGSPLPIDSTGAKPVPAIGVGTR